MKLRTVILATLSCGALLAVTPGGASANLIWCVDDPPLQVVTPGGQYLVINSTVYLPRSAVHLKSEITQWAEAEPDRHGGTLVKLHVTLPQGVSAYVVASDYRYQVSDEASTGEHGEGGGGDGGVTLYLDVPIS